ncbi:hypothetical protein HETIRDRAFT_169831 [Heterobasidion irregulare TC 32-1]|uniref:Uncharacterized protein n=1 Tax=Heterobasidion irregulare (strain TC 32-1) TaxID=747525 RepID=W4K5I5_HETIT|nr:uncharacterized protein HETIRDRAFT_169831 [Heterobasidion irregulare TC 32-1]ETW81088.1 hypothetical protein HETIRDRAFT_169831 [Heterobasidion irregulare TC 32-1]
MSAMSAYMCYFEFVGSAISDANIWQYFQYCHHYMDAYTNQASFLSLVLHFLSIRLGLNL